MTVEIGAGDIQIVASDRADTVVEVRPSDPSKKSDVEAAEQTRVEYSGGNLLVRAPKAWRQWTPRDGSESISVQIDLPAGSHVQANTAAASLRCTGHLGECRSKTGAGDTQVDQAGPLQLSAGAGDITVRRATGQVELTTGSGAVRVDNIDGTAVIKNSNGDTWIGEVSGDARVNAANGKIVVDHAHATITAKTANGDVRLGEVVRGAILAETAFGKVDIGILDGVAAHLDLKTSFGRLHNDLDAADRPVPGQDAVEVRGRTSYGDITVHRSFSDGVRTAEA